MSYLREAMSGAGGSVLAVLVAWMASRRDRARRGRDEAVATAAAKAVIDSERLAVIETVLPRLEADVKEIKVTAKDTNAKLGRLIERSGSGGTP